MFILSTNPPGLSIVVVIVVVVVVALKPTSSRQHRRRREAEIAALGANERASEHDRVTAELSASATDSHSTSEFRGEHIGPQTLLNFN